MSDPISEMYESNFNKSEAGTLTVGQAVIGKYYRLLDGKYANRVIINARERIDNQQVVRFANGLTWCFIEDIKDVRCELTHPTFPPAKNTVNHDLWYYDNSDVPMHCEW